MSNFDKVDILDVETEDTGVDQLVEYKLDLMMVNAMNIGVNTLESDLQDLIDRQLDTTLDDAEEIIVEVPDEVLEDDESSLEEFIETTRKQLEEKFASSGRADGLVEQAEVAVTYFLAMNNYGTVH